MANLTFRTELFSVAQLMKLVADGAVRVPLFQRGFAWKDEDRLQLFDSIAKAYPIGTLLLADGRAPAGTLRLGAYAAFVEARDKALWVVDGQQRISTLAMSLLGDFMGAHRPIFFDLEAEAFALCPRRRQAPATWVPAHVLLSARALNPWLRDAGLSNAHNDRADAITAALREYSVPAYVVPFEGDDRVPKEIFARINRRGRALTRQEVFDALHTDATGMKPLQRVDASLGRLGFGRPGLHVVERAAVALLGRAPGPLPEQLHEHRPDPAALFVEVEASLARAVEFLTNEAEIPHAEWLPYDGALPTLARFFALHPHPHPRNLELLGRWFWRATLSGDMQTNNAVDGHRWKAITTDEHRSAQALLALAPLPPSSGEGMRLHPYRKGTARSRIEAAALFSLEPRILVGEERGESVPMAAVESGELPWFLDVGPSEKTLAAGLLHPKLTSEDLQELRETPWDAALHGSHCIEPDAWEAFRRGDQAGFIQRRRGAVEAHLQRFLADKLGAHRDRDRPPLDAVLAAEDA